MYVHVSKKEHTLLSYTDYSLKFNNHSAQVTFARFQAIVKTQ